MSYRLSLLDKSPIPEGATAAEALQRTTLLAQRAEALGYHRFWVAEHHGTALLASSAPEVLAAHLLARTQRIRIGSGGVMLQHYAPYKVAEAFKLLAALAPGRVDLGVGKAPGGLPASTRALQARHDPSNGPTFAQLLADLDGFLSAAPGRALAGPLPPVLPERILLGGSPDSAELAAAQGWAFCYAGHFNGDPAHIERSLQAYRRAGGRAPLLALYALAAATQAEAERLAGALRLYKLHLSTGQSVNLPTLAAAAEFARQAGFERPEDYRIEELRPQVLAGTPERVRSALDALHREFGVAEFVIDTPVPDFDQRLASVELLARSFTPEPDSAD
ncbi:MsnO8 family LLM class oxidoreductase [Roseateles cavernae]|uniref:MsnO8 family LLM class oxidoreductase n=1 Tax=Roseateles cavernae TaxID=3153578 RepID=UPI0032E3E45D